jgi:hypothetical protein
MIGTRGGLGRIAAMVIGLAVVLLLALAGEARAGVYRAAQCGWGVGAELDPTYPATEGTAFSLNAAACVPPPGSGPGAMRLEAGVAASGSFGLARARWVAPAGTSFRAARLTWSGEPRWGNWYGLGFDVGDQFKLLLLNSGAGQTPIDLPIEGRAWAFEAWLQCAFTMPLSLLCDRSVASTMRLSGLTFTLEDQQAPQVRLGGPAGAGGWLRGTAALEVAATDIGAGVAAETATIDGAEILAAAPACAAATIEGESRATKLQPCPATAARSVEVDTARLADGPHALRGCATDFSGGQGCTPAELKVDNSPPAISFAAAAEGEVAATVSDRYAGPTTGTISVRRADADAWTDLPTTFDAEGEGAATLTARLPDLSAGVYRLRATAVDAAGNSGSAQLRVAGSPAELRRQAADGHGEKGAVGGQPTRRRRKADLTVRLLAVGGQADARRLLVDARWARIGNRTIMVAGRPGTGGSGLNVDYGTAVEVRGRLTEARGQGIGGRPVAITVRAAAGVGAPERRRVLTDPGGHFALRLPPGTSRRVAVAFHGGGGFAAARRRSLTLRVRAGVSLAAVPTELHTGESVHLRGHVRLGPARVARHGKLVAIQYLERATKRWRPALVVRTDAAGRFDTTYRFRYVTGVARIRLRATAPAEGGWPFARGSSTPVMVTVRGG